MPGRFLGPDDWSAFLEGRLDHPVVVRYGRSRSAPIQCRWEQAPGAVLAVRMHVMFGEAPPAVREAVARWIRSGRRARRACRALDQWIEQRSSKLPAPAARAPRAVPRGRCHDLERLAGPLWDAAFARDFGPERPRPLLTWGRASRSRSRRSLRLGSYVPESHLVRVHPVLDQPAVPDWYLRAVLHHEILHAAIPPARGEGGRWVHHGPVFRRRERAYPDHARAVAWEEEHLPLLIRSARTGRPLQAPRGKLGSRAGAVQLSLF